MGDTLKTISDEGVEIPTQFVCVWFSHTRPPASLRETARLHSAVGVRHLTNGFHIREIGRTHRLRTCERIVIVIQIFHIFCADGVYPVIYVIGIRTTKGSRPCIVWIKIHERAASTVQIIILHEQVLRRLELCCGRLIFYVITDTIIQFFHQRSIVVMHDSIVKIFDPILRIKLFNFFIRRNDKFTRRRIRPSVCYMPLKIEPCFC